MSGNSCEKKIQVGDILVGNIGYSMVLPVFYQVLSITPSGKSARIRRLADNPISGDGGWTGHTTPSPGVFVSNQETRRIKVLDYGSEKQVHVSISSCYLSAWDGKPRYFDYLD